MGQYDIFVIGGLLAAGGYVLWTYKDQIFPPGDGNGTPVDGETPTDGETNGGNGNGNGNGGGNGGGDGGSGDKPYDCAKACRNCWCKSYSEKCSGSCSKCKGASRVCSKCADSVNPCTGSSGGGDGGGGGAPGIFLATRDYYPYNNAMRITIS